MDHRETLTTVIRGALAERGITTLRDAAEATTLSKDALSRRYNGYTPWTIPDIEKICAFLELPASELVARTERAA